MFQPFDAKYLLLNLEDNHGASCTGLSEIRIGIDSETCSGFQPQVNVEYEVCGQEFYLSATSNDPNNNYTYKWSTGQTTAEIIVSVEGRYSLIIGDDNCTKTFEINVITPSLILNGWAKDTLIPEGNYNSEQPISTSGKIENGREVQFYIGGSVELLEGFQVSEDGILEIYIVDCGRVNSHYISQFTVNSNNSKIEHKDFLGNGNYYGLTTTSSSGDIEAISTLTGLGSLKEDEGYRFLTQVTFGGTEEMLEEIRITGIEPWIDWQLDIPHESYFNHLYFFTTRDHTSRLFWTNWNRTWWHNILTGENYLRDRMAFALSQIFVISSKSFLLNYGDGLTEFYDILAKNAFGNYRDLLYEVSLNPMMGFYLSHLNNSKTDETINQFPDENYAREILQLFSIGLYELNLDGSRKKDVEGKDIPTYTNTNVVEYAKIFTGLGTEGRPFGMEIWLVNNRSIKSYMTKPMIMHEEHHEQGEKHFLRGATIPSGQTGLEDINDALDNIFNHPNVGPFIGRQLIQRFVKSNPTPDYVRRVAEVFNDNGNGIRGDLKAVIKTILLDPEARDCSWVSNPDHGKLKEPLLRFSHLYKAFNIQSTSGTFYSKGLDIEESTGQGPLRSPSVFNFYQTTYRPPGILSDALLDAPEFQILNSSTAIGYGNMLDAIFLQDNVLPLDEGVSTLDYSTELSLVGDHDKLISHLNSKLTNGTLHPQTIATVKASLDQLIGSPPLERVKLAIYLIAISPEFVILK